MSRYTVPQEPRFTAEIKQTEEQIKDTWFGHGKYSKEKWMVVCFYIDVDRQELDGTITHGHTMVCTASADSYREMCGIAEGQSSSSHCVGCSLPFLAQYPLRIPDTMEELQAMGLH